jgi:glycosyltransferase involved in cell wall biosynthesis
MTVAVLLSTKNGARFLRPQIESIRAQGRPRIYWRDDGSSDDTIAIGQSLSLFGPLDTTPLGVTRSYARLLQSAWDDGCDYFSLADQDDVWHPFKLKAAVMSLAAITAPALYSARQTVVDETLRPIGTSPEFHQPIGFPAALTQNVASGCTIVMNRAAADLVLRTWDHQPFHDWWCYLIIAAAGGALIADSTEVMLYRQHRSNTIGMHASFLPRSIAAIRRGRGAFMTVFRHHIATLLNHQDLLSPTARHQLGIIASAKSLSDKWHVLQLPGLRRQTAMENLLFRLWYLL